MLKLLVCFIFMFFAFVASAATMQSYNCEGPAGRFDSNLELRSQEFYAGSYGCRAKNNTTYIYTVFPQLSVTDATITIQFYAHENKPFTIRGRLSNNTLVPFTMTSNQMRVGADGGDWWLKVFTYQAGSTASTLTLNTIEFSPDNTMTIDNISGTIASPLLTTFFKMQTGYDNILINISLDDILMENIKINTFQMEGRLPSKNSAQIFALDADGLNPFIFAECVNVSFSQITVHPYDNNGVAYEIGCLPASLANNQRGLFWVKNVGTEPLMPVKFVINLKTLPRMLDSATSSDFNYEMLLKTSLFP